MDSLKMKPEEIESESFRIIDEESGEHDWSDKEWNIVRRAIHTSADFEYLQSMIISEEAIDKGIKAIKSGCAIITDTQMALAGISKKRIEKYGCTVSCYVADSDVAEEAKKSGITRSVAAVRKGVQNYPEAIFVIGNAPTALYELIRLVEEGMVQPSLIIALPVGFVGAEESKNLLAVKNFDIPYITNIGRKGGSNVAAAVVNAIAIMAET